MVVMSSIRSIAASRRPLASSAQAPLVGVSINDVAQVHPSFCIHIAEIDLQVAFQLSARAVFAHESFDDGLRLPSCLKVSVDTIGDMYDGRL